jgi:hypothetical protein
MRQIPVTKRRKQNSRKKWIKISARFTNGETKDLAQFTFYGDAMYYLNLIRNGKAGTIEEIFID